MAKNIDSLLIKNRVIDNESNQISKVYFDNHCGESILKINTGGYLNNGFMYIDVDTSSLIEIYYKNILIFSAIERSQKMIPCLFESDTSIRINGECRSFTMLIYGAEPISDEKTRLVPLHHKIVKHEGCKDVVYNYTSIDDIKNKNLIIDMEINNLKYIQSFKINDESHLGYLYFDNGLCFKSSMDNYANSLIITNDCVDACIVPDVVNNSVYMMYIQDNCVRYKVINGDQTLSDEMTIKNIYNDQIRSFAYVSISEHGAPIFALNFANQKIMIMIIDNNEIKCRLVKKSKNVQIFLHNDLIDICDISNNHVEISQYEVIRTDIDIAIVSTSSATSIYNVDKVLKIEDVYLLFNSQYCTEVSDVELLGH